MGLFSGIVHTATNVGSTVYNGVNTLGNTVGNAIHSTAGTVAKSTSSFATGGSSPVYTKNPDVVTQTTTQTTSQVSHSFLGSLITGLHATANTFVAIGNAMNGVKGTIAGFASWIAGFTGNAGNGVGSILPNLIEFIFGVIGGFFMFFAGVINGFAGLFQYLVGRNGYQITAILIGALLLGIGVVLFLEESLSLLDTLGLEAFTNPKGVGSSYESAAIISIAGIALNWWAANPHTGSVMILALGITVLFLAARLQKSLFALGTVGSVLGFFLLYASYDFSILYNLLLTVLSYVVILAAYFAVEVYVKPRITSVKGAKAKPFKL